MSDIQKRQAPAEGEPYKQVADNVRQLNFVEAVADDILLIIQRRIYMSPGMETALNRDILEHLSRVL